AGTFSFTVRAANGAAPDAVTPTRTIIVALSPEPPQFTAQSPPITGVVGLPWTYQFKASGSPAPTFSVWTGLLPTRLNLDATTGVVSGTPTAGGTFRFTIRALNGVERDAITPQLTINVAATVRAPVFDAASPPSPATLGFPYSYQVDAQGSPEPVAYTLSSGAVPTGLHLDAATGLLSGTPTAVGSFSFRITASSGFPPDADSG